MQKAFFTNVVVAFVIDTSSCTVKRAIQHTVRNWDDLRTRGVNFGLIRVLFFYSEFFYLHVQIISASMEKSGLSPCKLKNF